MTQTSPYLAITDGTTTLTMADGSGGVTTALLERGTWAPQVAGLRPGNVGGTGKYVDVVEEVPLMLRGASAAATGALSETVERLITQAQQWSDGMNVAPVRLRYAPAGSDVATTANPFETTILGYENPADPRAITFDLQSESTRQLRAVRATARFRRRGGWYLAEQASNTVTGVTSRDKAALTFAAGSLSGRHPVRVDISGLTTANGQWHPGYLALAPSDSYISIYEAETIYTVGSSIASSETARGGNVRVVSATTSASPFVFSGAITTAVQFHVIAAIALVSGTWRARSAIYTGALAGIFSSYQTIAAPASGLSYAPQLVIFPPLRPGVAATGGEALFELMSATGSLQIDYVAAIGDGQIVKIGNPGGYTTTGTVHLEIDARPVTGLRPSVRVFNTATPVTNVTYDFDAYLTTTGSTLGVAWFQMENHATTPQWAITSGVLGTAKTHSVTAYRQPVFAVIQ